ncbi:MAG: hypothetical protein ACOYMA_04675 [Bacteroidia bacterium]
MKNYSLLIIFFLVAISSAYSQTTEEEFNYLTKGYQIQMESGLDMKKGYSTKEITDYIVNFQSGNYKKVTFRYLYKEDTKKNVAVLAQFTFYKKEENKTISKYLCIPLSNSELTITDRAFKQIVEFTDPENVNVMARALIKLSSHLITK